MPQLAVCCVAVLTAAGFKMAATERVITKSAKAVGLNLEVELQW